MYVGSHDPMTKLTHIVTGSLQLSTSCFQARKILADQRGNDKWWGAVKSEYIRKSKRTLHLLERGFHKAGKAEKFYTVCGNGVCDRKQGCRDARLVAASF